MVVTGKLDDIEFPIDHPDQEKFEQVKHLLQTAVVQQEVYNRWKSKEGTSNDMYMLATSPHQIQTLARSYSRSLPNWTPPARLHSQAPANPRMAPLPRDTSFY